MSRLTEHDFNCGPLTFGLTSWRAFSIAWSSAGRHDDNENPKGNDLTAYLFGLVIRLALPTIIRPFRQKVIAGWDAETIRRMGRDYYFNVYPRSYGFRYSDGFLTIFFGRQTRDSSTTSDWSCFLPWTQWRFVAMRYYGLNGELLWEGFGRSNYEAERKAENQTPTRSFLFTDFDGKQITATTLIEEREWHFGEGYFKWLRFFRKPKIKRSLDLRFSSEVGPEKGSWKGGTMGHGIDMLPGELHEDAFRRYCETEHTSKYRPFKINFIGPTPDSSPGAK